MVNNIGLLGFGLAGALPGMLGAGMAALGAILPLPPIVMAAAMILLA